MITVIEFPLAHGPFVALGFALLLSPVTPGVLAAVLERRWLRPAFDYLAFLIGDILLAAALAAGVELSAGHSLHQLVLVGGLVSGALMGCWQWRAEFLSGAYTREQVMSPTKMWHQVVILPLMTSWLLALTPEVWGGLLRHPLLSMTSIGCQSAWLGLLAYDGRHTKLGHAPFSWRRLGPLPKPWDATSSTLRSHANVQSQRLGS